MRKKNSGFTLIELLVTMLLMGILLSVGVPSLLNMLKENRLSAAAYAMVSDMNLARSEAVRTGSRVVFCHSAASGGNQCRATTTADDWQATGWLIGVDDDPTATSRSDQQIDGTPPEPMRTRDPMASGVKVTPTTTSANAALWFYPDGTVRDSAGRRSEAAFLMCSTDARTNGRTIEITRAGSVKINKTDDMEATACAAA